MRGQRACIFCSGLPLTNEYIYRDSFRALFPEMAYRQFAWTDAATLDLQPLHGELFDTQAKRVCAPCNNNWVNDIDIRAEPYLRQLVANKPCEIDIEGSRRIAAWAARVAMVRGFYRKDDPAIDPADLTFMYDQHSSPNSWCLDVAAREHQAFHDT